MSITYQLEESDGYLVDRFIEEAGPMLAAHYQEIEKHNGSPFDLDVVKYRMAERLQALRIFTARSDGQLIGYAIFLVVDHMHSKDRRQALDDSLYLDSAWRKGHIGINLIKYSDQSLANEGVHTVMRNVTPGLDYSPILDYLGYEPVAVMWCKCLNAPHRGS